MDIAIYKFNSDTDTLPAFNDGYTYAYTDVDNGDGTITRTITSNSLPTSISFTNRDGLVSLSYLDTSNVTDMTGMFNRCSNLTSIDVSSFDTSKVTNMSGMFYICSNLTSIDVSSFDTSSVTNMEDMFWSCRKLTSIKGLNNWDTSNVTTIAGIFSYCNSLTSSLDLSSWNTSSMTNIRYLAASCFSLPSVNLSGWDTSKVIHMDRMFEFSDFTELNLSGWDTSSVRYFTDMFKYADALKTVIMKDSDATSISEIIHQLLARTADSPGLILVGKDMDTSSIDTTSANEKYWHVVPKEYKIADFTFNSDTDTLPTFNSGFTYEYIDSDDSNGIITRTIVSNSLPTSVSFAYKTGLVSLSYLDTSNVTDMGNMFSNCENMTSIDVSSFDTSKATNMSQLFYKCMKLTSIDVSNWDTSEVTDMRWMFSRCYELTELNLSNFNTSKVTTMSRMFQECNTLTVIGGLNNWNTSSVTDISYMFDGCIELIELNLGSFDASKVTTMYSIFQNCKKLRTLNISNLNINDTANTGWMFYNCESLISINMDCSDTNTINNIISNLPNKTPNNQGTLTVPNLNDNAINISSAQSKYWNLVASPQYAFDIDTITYFISKIKEKFAAISELKNKVNKEEGKDLSTNNFSNEEKDHIENSFNDVTLVDNILVFYSTSESGDKVIVETFDLDI